jgi:hypothetical protein
MRALLRLLLVVFLVLALPLKGLAAAGWMVACAAEHRHGHVASSPAGGHGMHAQHAEHAQHAQHARNATHTTHTTHDLGVQHEHDTQPHESSDGVPQSGASGMADSDQGKVNCSTCAPCNAVAYAQDCRLQLPPGPLGGCVRASADSGYASVDAEVPFHPPRRAVA